MENQMKLQTVESIISNLPQKWAEKWQPRERQRNEIIIKGYHFPIRSLQNNEVELSVVVSYLTEKYGGRKSLDKFTIKTIVEDLILDWSHFGIDEISLAFRMWAKGELNVTGAEIYGGEINTLPFNRILKAFQIERNKILKEYTEFMNKREFEAEQAAKRAEEMAKIDKMFDHEIKHEVEKCETYDKIPKWVLDQIAKRKMLRVSPVIQSETKERAKQIVQAECESEASDLKINLNTYMQQLESTIEAREHWTYCRLITFENL